MVSGHTVQLWREAHFSIIMGQPPTSKTVAREVERVMDILEDWYRQQIHKADCLAKDWQRIN